MGHQTGSGAMTFGGTVHTAFPGLQDTSRTRDIFLSRAAQKCRLHVRRHPTLSSPPQRHDRQPHCHVRGPHKHHAADEAPRALERLHERNKNRAFAWCTCFRGESIWLEKRCGCQDAIQLFNRCGWSFHRPSGSPPFPGCNISAPTPMCSLSPACG